MTTRTYSVEQLVSIAEAAEPFAALLKPHHAGKRDAEPLYQINRTVVTFGQLRALVRALAESTGETS